MYKIILLISFCFCASHAAAVNNTLNYGDTLNSTDTLVSNNGLFALRFYYSENPDSSYLGIWYNNSIIDKPFWLANRATPVSMNSASLTLDTTGQLILTDASRNSITLYSAPSTTKVAAVLQDSGNFVLQEVSTSGSTGQILWESFDFPTDSFLPGMKLGVNHKTGKNWSLTSWLTDSIPTPGPFTLEWDPSSRELVVRRRGVIFWTSGVLMNNTFENIFLDAERLSYNFITASNVDEDYLVYSLATNEYTPVDLMNFSMWSLYSDGIWDQYSSRGILKIEACDGNSTDNGCERWEGRKCRNDGDKFAKRSGYFVNTVRTTVNENASLTISDCKDICWKDCSCVGVANSNTNDTGCIFWYDGSFTQDLTGAAVSYHVIIPDSRPPGGKEWTWISIAILIALIMILLGILFCLRRTRIKQKGET